MDTAMNIKMNNKRGQGHSFWIIVTMVIALVVVILVIMWFSRGGAKGFGEVEKKLGGLGDCDKDGAADMFDKCPCDPGKTELKEGETCGSAGSEAVKNCPEECR